VPNPRVASTLIWPRMNRFWTNLFPNSVKHAEVGCKNTDRGGRIFVQDCKCASRLVPLKCIVGVVGFESAKSINPQNRESWHRLLGLPPGSSTPFAFAHRLTDRFLFTPSKMMSKCLPGQWVVTIPRLFLQEHKHLMSPDLTDKVLRAIQRVAQKNAPYSL
jgi:hypothetical protein